MEVFFLEILVEQYGFIWKSGWDFKANFRRGEEDVQKNGKDKDREDES